VQQLRDENCGTPRTTPVKPAHWQSWAAIADLFVGPADPDWERDRDLIDQTPNNVWDINP
jgi:hypothetical protein